MIAKIKLLYLCCLTSIKLKEKYLPEEILLEKNDKYYFSFIFLISQQRNKTIIFCYVMFYLKIEYLEKNFRNRDW